MKFLHYIDLSADARVAIGYARATGSVGCTHNDTKAERLYTHQGGIGGGSTTATNLWIISSPDGTQGVVQTGPVE